MSIGETAWDIGNGILGGAQTINDFAQAGRGADTPLSGPFKALAPLNLYNGLDELANGETWMDQVGGGIDTIGAGAGMLELAGFEAGPVGMLAGAAATGWGVGTRGNKNAEKWGFMGENEDGSNKSISQWWGDIAFNPMTAQNAGPSLVAGGAMALGSEMAMPFLDLFDVDAPMSSKQQREMNHQSSTTFDSMRGTGMSDAAAENLAAMSNPDFHEVREQSRNRDALAKAGLPPAVVQMLAGAPQ